jgi:hypothetical protein
MRFVAPYSLVSASGNLAVHFHADHLMDLRKSGLSDETIRAAGVYSLAPAYISRFFSPHKGIPEEIESALCFPYQGGEFARIKLFPALGKMKYSQPPGTGARLYMPFPADTRALGVVEGEKKTLAAHQAGLNAVGIGGIWNWISNGEPITDIMLIPWDGRDVTIIPDSDVFHRGDLLRAVYALGRELRAQGAAVTVAQIPQSGTDKVGLDDFLVGGGNIAGLDTVTLGGKDFRSASFWYGRWKMKAALAA